MNAASVIVLTADEFRAVVRELREEFSRPAEAEVLTLEQAGHLLQLHPKVVMKYVDKHGLPAHPLGREWRFRRHEILAWLGSQKKAAV